MPKGQNPKSYLARQRGLDTKKCYHQSIDKLQLTGQNLGRVFNFRSVDLHVVHLWGYQVKLSNLKLKLGQNNF
jgi:hypothetical protein